MYARVFLAFFATPRYYITNLAVKMPGEWGQSSAK